MFQLRPHHRVQLLEGCQDFFAALIQDIDRSVLEIRLETYIFELAASGVQVALALERAARRGVAVYLVMDGVGTPSLAPEWAARFDAAGVHWRIFLPLGQLGLLIPSRWRRLHRKLCVVDGKVAYCGGINLLDDLYDPNHGVLEAPRFDFAVRVTGPLVQTVHLTLSRFWWRMQALSDARQSDFSAAWQALQEALEVREAPAGAPNTGRVAAGEVNGTHADLVLRDNLRNRFRIERTYRQLIGSAHTEIIIANAYFLPGRKLRKALIYAAKRGVRVRLLLQGRYEYFMQYHAARPVYGALLAAGVEIYEYAASFLHAKVAVIDGRWATVGSSNLDPLSLLLAREANVLVDDVLFAKNLRQRLEQAMEKDGIRVDPVVYLSRPWQQRWLDRGALALMRLLLLVNGMRY